MVDYMLHVMKKKQMLTRNSLKGKGIATKGKKMEAAINKLQEQLQSDKESAIKTNALAKMKDIYTNAGSS